MLKLCVYCGALASDRDHVIPRSYFGNGATVPACRQCNSYLSNKMHVTVCDRAHYLLNHRKVRKHYSAERLSCLEGSAREGPSEIAAPTPSNAAGFSDSLSIMHDYSKIDANGWHRKITDAWRHGCTARAWTNHMETLKC